MDIDTEVREDLPQEEATMPDEDLLTFDEALQVLGTSRPTLYRLLNHGAVKGLKVGKQWRFRRTDLIAYMEAKPTEIESAPVDEIKKELAFFCEELRKAGEDVDADKVIAGTEDETMVAILCQFIIRDAIVRRSSDIHLEITRIEGAEHYLLRYRIDGLLTEIRRLPLSLVPSIIAQFKMMSDLNVGEKRLPQEGRIPVRYRDTDFDVRVTTTPTYYAESLVLRILNRTNVLIGIDNLGLFPDDIKQITNIIHQPNGIIIFNGPGGSGKTTTAYSCMQILAVPHRKMMTVEDPIELVLDYVAQSPIYPKLGLGFAEVLRSFMRQDPDIIYASEIRDLKTMQIIIEMALTGHLVMSTLHAPDGVSAIQRMQGMGDITLMLAPALLAIISQRLARRLCEHCKTPIEKSAIKSLDPIRRIAAAGGYEVPDDAVFYTAQGCENCKGRGYQGRIGLFEIIEINEPIADAIQRSAGYEELASLAVESGAHTLWADGLRKAASGLTTIDEIRRVVFTAGF